MTKKILEQKWYLLEQPWCHSRDSGLTILAGSNDPHKAVAIADTMDLLGEKYDNDVGREIAQHIVDLHNKRLRDDDMKCPSCSNSYVRMFDADNNQCIHCGEIISVC